MGAWDLWERAHVPSLLSGAGTWVGSTKDEDEEMRQAPGFVSASEVTSTRVIPTHCTPIRDKNGWHEASDLGNETTPVEENKEARDIFTEWSNLGRTGQA